MTVYISHAMNLALEAKLGSQLSGRKGQCAISYGCSDKRRCTSEPSVQAADLLMPPYIVDLGIVRRASVEALVCKMEGRRTVIISLVTK